MALQVLPTWSAISRVPVDALQASRLLSSRNTRHLHYHHYSRYGRYGRYLQDRWLRRGLAPVRSPTATRALRPCCCDAWTGCGHVLGAGLSCPCRSLALRIFPGSPIWCKRIVAAGMTIALHVFFYTRAE